MIVFKTGNILNERVDALVNTVNCVGIMGRGIAAQFKRLYPFNFKVYEKACKNGEVQPGHMFTVEVSQTVKPYLVINFPTKRHWKGKSKISDIEAGLNDLSREIESRNLQSVAVPPLGCGLGGLDWRIVKPMIVALAEKHPSVQFVIYEPDSEAYKNKAPLQVAKMTPGVAVLVCIIEQYLKGLLDPSITLLELHKLGYFLQHAGLPLKYQFEKQTYGPFITNLCHILQRIEGVYLTGYDDGGNMPLKELCIVPGAMKEANAFFEEKPTVQPYFQRVADLIEGFESPAGLELLSTVHWVIFQESAKTLEEVVEKVHAWNDHKKQFSPRQIGIAYGVLKEKGWLEKTGS